MTTALAIRDLTVTAPTGRMLLSVPVLEVAAGTHLGLRGPSGAGKSTLLFALAGLDDGARGTVQWGEVDILAQPASARADFRRTQLGIVFQDYHLFEELSAAGNAAITALFSPASGRADIRQRTQSSLAQLGLNAPNQNAATLSGGERQRVAVARALAQDPGILLADEPTANLSRDAADALITDLTGLAKPTLIVASHDDALLASMDRVLTLADGKVVADD